MNLKAARIIFNIERSINGCFTCILIIIQLFNYSKLAKTVEDVLFEFNFIQNQYRLL